MRDEAGRQAVPARSEPARAPSWVRTGLTHSPTRVPQERNAGRRPIPAARRL